MASAFYGSMRRPPATNTTASSGAGAVADWNSKGRNPYTADPLPNTRENPAITTKSPKLITDSTALLGSSTVDLLPGKPENSLNAKQNFANTSDSYGNAAQDQRTKIQNDTQARISKIERETKAATAFGDNSGNYVGTYTASLAPGINRITTQFQQSGSNIASTYQTSTGVSGVGSGTISGNVGSMTWQNTSPNCPGAFQGTYVFDSDKVTFSANGQDCLGVEVIKGEARRVN